MTVKYKDYYEVLGVARTATAGEIQKAFRDKAKTAHPDVDRSPGAEDRFKELNEAYEVLKDAEARARYDKLGANWQAGQDFTPPPDWGEVPFEFDLGGADLGGFSDFFSSLFGGGGFTQARRQPMRRRGHDQEVEVTLSLEEVAQGGSKSLQISSQGSDSNGRPAVTTQTYDVKLPVGLTDGTRIRLEGQGGAGIGGPAGDLYLVVRLAEHPRFEVSSYDLRTACAVTPWEAALGTNVTIQTLSSSISLVVPSGTQSGQVLRLRGQGLRRDAEASGDLLVEMRIVVPEELTDAERELFEKLSVESRFQPDSRTSRPARGKRS